MFYFLSKTIFYFAMPLTWVIGLFLFSIITKNKIYKRKTFITGFILLMVFSNSVLVNVGLHLWEVPITPYQNIKKPYDVAIVLTGIVEGGKPVKDRIYFGSNVDRITNALDLYKLGKVKNILITGGTFQVNNKKKQDEANEATALAAFLIECGVPKDNIFIEPNAKNTRENALFSAKILKEKFPDQNFLLVTSSYHMHRALGCFKKAGIYCTAFSTDLHQHKFDWGPNSFFPQEDALSQWHELIHEIIGYIVYKIMGYC